MRETRQTSIEAYIKIKENGLLSKRRFQVYDCVYHHGPMGVNECRQKLNENGIRIQQNSTNPRFSELRDMGLLEELGTKICNVTGMTVIEWNVTSNLPTELPKKITHAERIRRIKIAIRPWIPRPDRDSIFRSLDKLQ